LPSRRIRRRGVAKRFRAWPLLTVCSSISIHPLDFFVKRVVNLRCIAILSLNATTKSSPTQSLALNNVGTNAAIATETATAKAGSEGKAAKSAAAAVNSHRRSR
jgi:hypothetical protein